LKNPRELLQKEERVQKTNLRTFKRSTKWGPSVNEREEDTKSSGLESSSEDESHEAELKITINDVIDSKDSELEFSRED